MKVGLVAISDQFITSKTGVIVEIGNKLEQFFEDKNYGDGINMITIGVILIDHHAPGEVRPIGKLKFRKKWTFKRTSKSVPVIFTDIAEYDIKPDYDAFSKMSYQEGAKYLAALLLDSLKILVANRKKFPNFDTGAFERDLKKALEEFVVAIPADLGVGSSDKHNAPIFLDARSDESPHSYSRSSVGALPIADFPVEALAFVERELPNVRRAVEEKNRVLLEPIFARIKAFYDRWGLKDSSPSEALNMYPTFATLVVNLMREGAIELMDASDAERAKVHREFQRELDACRAAATKSIYPRSH